MSPGWTLLGTGLALVLINELKLPNEAKAITATTPATRSQGFKRRCLDMLLVYDILEVIGTFKESAYNGYR